MQTVVATSGLEAQNKLAELVKAQKAIDPFKHITLVVESHHQALQFRRQLVRSLQRIGASSSLIAFSALTKVELLSKLAEIAKINWSYDQFDTDRQISLRKVLAERNATFERFANHAESFETILNYTRQFDWLILTEEIVREIKTATREDTTKVSLELLDIVLLLQLDLKSSGHLSPADVAAAVSSSNDEDIYRRAKTSLGYVISLVKDFPVSLEDTLTSLITGIEQIQLVLAKGSDRETQSKISSYPDPETEVKAVVREVALKISEGYPVDQFAVLYASADQYADLLSNEFDEAGIAWNGISTDSPALTRPAQATRTYLETIIKLLNTGTFAKTDLNALFRLFSITVNGQEIKVGPIEKLISKNGYLNEVTHWLPLLQNSVDQLETLNQKLEQLISWNAEQADIDEVKQEIRQAENSAQLIQVIEAIKYSADRLAATQTFDQLADLAWSEINAFFPQLESFNLPADKVAFEKLGQMLTSQHNDAVSGVEQAAKALQLIKQSIFLKLSKLKMQHGELARGVYIGPVSQNGGLYFENLWIVGAGDGMLPQQISEDPIFPDLLKSQLEINFGAKFAQVTKRYAEVEANYFAVTTGAKHLSISYPRAATLAKSEGKPSAWLGQTAIKTATEILAPSEFRLESANAIARGDLSSKQSAQYSGAGTSASRQLDSAVWFAAPNSGAFAGDVSAIATGKSLFDLEGRTLSASSVEKFLKCNHNFFVVKILGISDYAEDDFVEEMRAVDFGKAVHKSFDRLLKEHPTLNPEHGEAYSDEAKSEFKKIFDEECDLIVARGQAGWAPLFESRKQGFIDLIDLYFEQEAEVRQKILVPPVPPAKRATIEVMSQPDLLSPQLSEFEFHKQGNGALVISVEAPGLPVQQLRFTGSIDRIDVSKSNEHVGLVDFKTGRKSNFDSDMAIQDILYEYAVLHSTSFVGVKKVSAKYLFLAKTAKETGWADFRRGLDSRVFLPEDAGGLTGEEYSKALVANLEVSEVRLKEKLAGLVTALFEGKFLTHDVDAAEKSFQYCPTCDKLGKRQVSQLSRQIHAPIDLESVDSDGGDE